MEEVLIGIPKTEPVRAFKVSEVSQGCLTRHIYANVLDNDTVTQHHSQILVLCLDVNRPWHRTSWGLSLISCQRGMLSEHIIGSAKNAIMRKT